MSSFAGNSRPAHVTALSGKVNNLRFMQRANAAQASHTGSPSVTDDARSKELGTGSSASSAQQASPRVTTEQITDDTPKSLDPVRNEEHWTLAPKTSAAGRAAEHPLSTAEPEGWNTWLVTTSSSTSSTSRRRNHRLPREDETNAEEEGNGTSGSALMGRRSFGKFALPADGTQDDTHNDSDGSDDQRGKRRRKPLRKSMSPEVEFDAQGQLKVPSKGARKRSSAPERPTTMREHARDKSKQQQKRGFLKPGEVSQGPRSQRASKVYDNSGSDADDLDFGPEDLNESFADNDDPDVSSTASHQGQKKNRKLGKKQRV
ncbi:unnamed protein product [Parajaminaea phylloscopi]